jgi:hypothetical protein
MNPMLSRKGAEFQQFLQANSLGALCLIIPDEELQRFLRTFFGFVHPDILKMLLSFNLNGI